ncbi:MAG: amidohydrolase [Vicinamibacterales bacterium]
MSTYTRGEFLGLAGLMAGAMACGREIPASPAVGRPTEADLVLINGRVFTVDDAQPRAEAFAVKDGRFIAVGTTADVRNLATSRTTVIDAAGMTVTPGFIDAHSHPNGVDELFGVNGNVRTLKELQDALRARAARTSPEQWVTAFMFDDTKFDVVLDRHHLDAAVPDRPVVVNHRGGHTSWYNTAALDLADINKSTPDPKGGQFLRDRSGELTGRVAELARAVFDGVGTRETFTEEEQRRRALEGMVHMSKLFAAAGLTSVHDAQALHDQIVAYQDAYHAGELRHRVYYLFDGALLDTYKAAGVYTGLGNEWVRVGGAKFVADGSCSERTMLMSTAYVGRPNDYGIQTMTEAEIVDAVENAHRHNFQVGIHANGDVAIDLVLKAYERVLAKWPHPDRRHRIEHCTLVNENLLGRIAATGSIPTPFWTYVYYHGEKWTEYGDDKLRSMFAHRSFLDHGIKVPGASDYQPGPFEPLMAMQSMVTRRDYKGREWGPNQRISVDDALRVATLHGAHASYEEGVKGSITAGKYADFVVLDRDPHEGDPNTIKDIKIVRTVVGGKTTFGDATT